MAAYESHYTENTYTQTGSITIDNPATVDDGDILLYFIQQQPAASQGTISSDGGLTEVLNEVGASFEGSIALYSVEADGTEDGGSEDFSSTDTSTVMDGACIRISGAGVVSDSSHVFNGASSTCDVPTVDADGADSLLISILGGGSVGSEWTPTQPTGMTLGDTSFQAWATSIALAYEVHADGATGTQQWSSVPTDYGTWGVNIVLTDAGGGGSIAPQARYYYNMQLS
ncbi:MAG: hypothetical protein ACPG6R_11870 [Aequoribacter sp.]|uniref:hypothetical protein n=1 Tax=Aequoribacter sp. TaxID=2847771 RepID=UPI003C5DEEC3